jgi:hypothetical protein
VSAAADTAAPTRVERLPGGELRVLTHDAAGEARLVTLLQPTGAVLWRVRPDGAPPDLWEAHGAALAGLLRPFARVVGGLRVGRHLLDAGGALALGASLVASAQAGALQVGPLFAAAGGWALLRKALPWLLRPALKRGLAWMLQRGVFT